MSSNNTLRSLLFLLAFGAAGVLRGQDAASQQVTVIGPGQCEECHKSLPDERLRMPTQWMQYDIHAREQIGCADCHGGDAKAPQALAAHSKAKNYVGIPEPQQIPDLCDRCHNNASFLITYNPSLPVDQHEKYLTSRHGQLLKMGLRKVAQCSSCHTSHNVRPATDPNSSVYPVNLPGTCNQCHGDPAYMAGFPIPTDQYAKYAASVHGVALLDREDLGSPACNDCHGNHGAIPPGSQSLGHVCGTCHALNADLFNQSAHAAVFAIQELSQCTVCHDHHAIAPPSPESFNMSAASVCIGCHKPGDAGWETGKKMFAEIEKLDQLEKAALSMMETSHKLGMDVSESDFLMKDFRKARLQLRTVSHALNMDEFEKVSAEAAGHVAQALSLAQSAYDEFYYRRRGLLVSLILCFPMLILLYLKIKSVD